MKRQIYITFIFLFSCTQNENQKHFQIPFIVQQPISDSITILNVDSIQEVFPVFAGKYKFKDTLRVNNDYRVDSIFWNDVYKLDWYNHYKIWDSLNLSDSNLSIIADYNNNIYYKSYFSNPYNCFPVYIINETQKLNGFEFKDGHIFGIQEAIDSNGIWRPIECRGMDFCGNGRKGIKIYSNEYLLILFNKYSGSYKTKIRIRINANNAIYTSKPFIGFINYSQFYLTKDLQNEFSEDNKSIEWRYYGGNPLIRN